MKKNEVVLTEEIFQNIQNKVIGEIIELKKEQGIFIDKITVQQEVLHSLKNELKQLKGKIRENKKSLNNKKRKLSRINRELSRKNNSIIEVNSNFIDEEEKTINLNDFFEPEVKKMR